ncbi:hypothetical protein [Arenimonas sp.]|uniref:hypothetical protein n=1 Tax=Arenimonas sp. TaxID=1872635 RepID=UPI0025B81D4F|nr:hypothetical protein [Arenimonas sp.]
MRNAILLAALVCAGHASAQSLPGDNDEIGDDVRTQTEGVEPFLEYKKRVETAQSISPLDNGLFGESVSLYNGSTSFKVVDIDLPGNNGLPVRLAREFTVDIQPQGTGPAYDTLLRGLGNWQVDVPHMSATYAASSGWPDNRCSGGSVPSTTAGAGYFYRAEYWNGISIHLPGRGSTKALGVTSSAPAPTTGAAYRMTTTERDFLDCIPMSSGLPGDGFRLTTTSGTRYYFDVGVVRTASRLDKGYIKTSKWFEGEAELPVYLPRNHYYLLASKVEDEFGNTVHFQYNAAGHPTRIWSNDGREIQLNYSEGRLVSAVADGRLWQYQYSPNAHLDPNPNLAAVILPDLSRWEYTYTGNLKPLTPLTSDSLSAPWCAGLTVGIEQDFTLEAKHPSGATGVFSFTNLRHYRSGVHATECVQGGPPLTPTYALLTPYYFDVMSLMSKAVSGPGLSASSWIYDYGDASEFLWGTPSQQPVYPCTSCTVDKFVVVTNPDGTKRRHRFGKMYRFNEARTLGTEILDASGAVISAEASVYLSEPEATSQLFHGSYGSVLGGISDPMGALVRPVVSRTITQQARNFIWRVDTNCGPSGTAYCFDHLARPTKVVRSSTQP